jgi:hypothetical protein
MENSEKTVHKRMNGDSRQMTLLADKSIDRINHKAVPINPHFFYFPLSLSHKEQTKVTNKRAAPAMVKLG